MYCILMERNRNMQKSNNIVTGRGNRTRVPIDIKHSLFI